MGKKLKQQRDSVKINRLNILEKRGGACEQHPAFSYQHLTTNKEYNFEYFKDKNERMRAQSAAIKRLEEISENEWKYWNTQSKNVGLESIEYSGIYIIPKGIVLSPDPKIYVFRFCSQEYRILGFRKESCPILFIIGYDFAHNAYNHGK